jgi:hypothetical protein
MKSVPNLILYLHEFFLNFSQFIAIYFKLFSSMVIFNSENTEFAIAVATRLIEHSLVKSSLT